MSIDVCCIPASLAGFYHSSHWIESGCAWIHRHKCLCVVERTFGVESQTLILNERALKANGS